MSCGCLIIAVVIWSLSIIYIIKKYKQKGHVIWCKHIWCNMDWLTHNGQDYIKITQLRCGNFGHNCGPLCTLQNPTQVYSDVWNWHRHNISDTVVNIWRKHDWYIVTSISNVNSLWPGDTIVTIWRNKSGSTLAQVMACCLTAPSYYLNQCWLIIRFTPTRDTSSISH